MATTLNRPTATNLLVAEKVQLEAAAFASELHNHPVGLAVATRSARAKPRPMPKALAQIIAQVVEAIAAGQTVTVSTLPEELSTTVAAENLGISRPTLMKMIRASEIPAHKVGSHHRLKSSDVLDFKRRRREEQRQALAALNALLDEDD